MATSISSESMAGKLWHYLEGLRETLREKEQQKAELEVEIPRLKALVEAINHAYELERQYEQTKVQQLALIPLPNTLSYEVVAVLDDGVTRTVQEIVEALRRRNWPFESRFPGRSVHAALIAVSRRGLAVKEDDKWRKK